MDNGRWLSVAIVTSVWKYAREHFIESMAVWSKGLLTCEYFIANAEFLIYHDELLINLKITIEKGTFYYYLFFSATYILKHNLFMHRCPSMKTGHKRRDNLIITIVAYTVYIQW